MAQMRVYYDTNITSGRILRDLKPDPEMDALDELEALHAAGSLKRVSSKWSRIEQARTRDPIRRAAFEAQDHEMSCVQQDHRLIGFAHQDLGRLGFIASPIVSDVVDEAVFAKLLAAGIEEKDEVVPTSAVELLEAARLSKCLVAQCVARPRP